MKYSLVICAYNEGPKLAATLDSIRKSLKATNRQDVEVIVIDDASHDNTRVSDLGDDRVSVFVNKENRGISYSRNQGIQKASGEYVVFMDAHILIPENVAFFEELDASLSEGNVDGVSGVYETKDKKKDQNHIRDLVRTLYRNKTQPQFLITYDAFTTVSSCVFCIKKTIIQHYMFNDEFKGVAAEDTMLQLYFLKDGVKILHNPKVRIIHDAKISYGGLLSKILYQAKGTNRLLAKAAKKELHVPYSAFFLDFPIWTFIVFWVGGLAWVLGALPFSRYVILLAISLFLDFFTLSRVIEHKGSALYKAKVILYLLANEGIKIITWPLSLISESYTPRDVLRVLRYYAYFYAEKVKGSVRHENIRP